MADASVVLKVIDRISPGLSAIRRATQETGRSFDELGNTISAYRTRNDALKQNILDTELALKKARIAVTEATADFKKSNTEANETNLKNAIAQYDQLTENLKDFKAQVSDTRKQIKALEEEQRKSEIGSLFDFTGRLMDTGLVDQVKSAAANYGSTIMSSAWGSTQAGVVEGILSGGISGAAAGFAAGGPAGAAVGAVLGAGSGILSGLAEQQTREDDAFRSYRDALIEDSEEKVSGALSGGVSTAATREQNQIGFTALLGSPEAASELLGQVKDLANVTPYVYDDLTGIARNLAIFDSTSGNLYDNLVTIGDAGSALNLSASSMEGLAQLLGKIGDTEKYSSEFTRSLRNYGINPASIFAEYYGISTAEANALLTDKKNPVSGSDALTAILSVLESHYGGMMEAQSHTYAGAMSTREGLLAELGNFMGEGYNAERVGMLDEHNAWLQEFAQGEAYGIIGRSNAQRDNLQDKFYEEVMGGIFNGDATTVVDEKTQTKIDELRTAYLDALEEYETADADRQMVLGNDIANIMTKAEALATASVDATSVMQEIAASEADVVSNTAQMVALLGSFRSGITVSIAQGRGLASAQAQNGTGLPGIFNQVGTAYMAAADYYSGNYAHRASGQRTIPYDGYPILAHEGEMLLTASEARNYRENTASVLISGNTFVVRQESDIDAIADALYRKFLSVSEIMA